MPRITLTALALLAAPLAAQADARQADAFARADTNHDGLVTRPEVAAQKAALFARIDRNHDGSIDSAEVARLQRVAKRAEAGAGLALDAADSNGDGVISQAEFVAYSPLFTLADANDDGALSASEIARIRGAIASR